MATFGVKLPPRRVPVGPPVYPRTWTEFEVGEVGPEMRERRLEVPLRTVQPKLSRLPLS